MKLPRTLAASALAAAALLGVAVAPAGATGEILAIITAADEARLEQFEAAKAAATADARRGGSPADLAAFEEILAREHLGFDSFDMTGEWQCRTIKAGGAGVPLVIYGWFRCRVTDDGSGWKLEKLGGSQRTTGRFFTESDSALTYLGVFHVAGNPAPAYGAGPESDQVGRAFRTGSATWQIEFPLPTYESKFDILEFRR